MDKLQSITGGPDPRTYTYDVQGRTKTIDDTSGLTQFDYDYDGRATTITYPSSASDTFTYNGAGARMSTAGTSGSRTFRRAGIGVLSGVMSDGTKDYTPGVSSRESGVSTFQHSGLKNTLDQTNSSEAVTASRHYDASLGDKNGHEPAMRVDKFGNPSHAVPGGFTIWRPI